MSEFIKKIIIPTLDGERELSLDHKANVDDVYNKEETYNKKEVYNKEETYSKTEAKDIVDNSSNKSAELLVNVLLAYNSLGEGQSLNILSDWPIDGATGLDIINDDKGLKGIAQYNSDATNNTKILYTRDNLIYSESTSSFTIRINGTDTYTLTIPSPKAYTSIDENVTSMKSMFVNCNSLTTLDLSSFDTSNVTDMYNMFAKCNSLTTLDLSSFDTSKVTDMFSMFYNCSSLTTLDLSSFDTSKVTNMLQMFMNCKSLTTLDLSNFDTSNVTNIEFMFYGCSSLTTLDLSSFDTSKVTGMDVMFKNCSSLTTVTGPITGIKVDLDLSYSPLTADSAMVFINGLSTVTSTKTLKLKSTTYDLLTPEQIAIATSKGWNVTRS